MKYLVHCSNPNLGGAEKSVADKFIFQMQDHDALFLLPDPGPLSDFLGKNEISVEILSWPPGMTRLSQRKLNRQWYFFFFLPVYIIPWLNYLWRFKKRINKSDVVFSSGIKSHFICLLIAFFSPQKIILNVRDFVEPVWLRKILSGLCRVLGIFIEANSRAVGRDYFNPEIKYPILNMGQKPGIPREKDSPLMITHLAYFAPYKGQELFLDYARMILDRGISARFMMIGDVIYPENFYLEYKQRIIEKVSRLNLEEFVKVTGKVDDPMDLLSQSDIVLHCTTGPEPFGRVVIESLQNGCDVICHKGNGCLEILENISSVESSALSGIVDSDVYCFLEASKVRINYPD